jgi:uncharacterized membrane protein
MPICKWNTPVTCKIEDAFEYIAEWTNLKDFMPMFVALKPVSLVMYGPGLSLEATMVLGKVEISTTLDLVEFLKNKRIMYKSMRGLKAKVIWELKEQPGDKTLLLSSFEYEIPPGLVRGNSEREAIEKELEGLVNQSMNLLKWVLESKAAAAHP